MEAIATIGRGTLGVVQTLGSAGLFILYALWSIFTPPYRFKRIITEIEFIGAKSILIILVTALFTGMVLALQGYYTLSKFGAEGVLGSAVALSIIRELGPVLCALMVTGRAGSAITAEIGIMKITDQVPALEMMAIEPIKFIVSPKVVAALISLPILTVFFDLVGILGGFLVGVLMLGVNEGSFFGEMIRATEFSDIYGGLIKSVAFGFLIAWISCFVGYHAKATTEGVASATTNAVVMTSLSILIVDYVITSVLL
jgi:phospholipid/cholesterol/gamma-HCH transport system permease protein